MVAGGLEATDAILCFPSDRLFYRNPRSINQIWRREKLAILAILSANVGCLILSRALI
jgi:hypothetical protein